MEAPPLLFSERYGGKVAVPGLPVLYWLVREGILKPHSAFLGEPGILDASKWSLAWLVANRTFTEMRDVPFSEKPASGCWTWPEAAVKTVEPAPITEAVSSAKIDPPKSEPKKNEQKK